MSNKNTKKATHCPCRRGLRTQPVYARVSDGSPRVTIVIFSFYLRPPSKRRRGTVRSPEPSRSLLLLRLVVLSLFFLRVSQHRVVSVRSQGRRIVAAIWRNRPKAVYARRYRFQRSERFVPATWFLCVPFGSCFVFFPVVRLRFARFVRHGRFTNNSSVSKQKLVNANVGFLAPEIEIFASNL